MDIISGLGWVVLYMLIGLFIAGMIEDPETGINIGVMVFWPLWVLFVVVIAIIALFIGFVAGIKAMFRK